MIGVVTELFDAIGEACIGDDHDDAFHGAIESAPAGGVTDVDRIGLAEDEFGERVEVVFVEGLDKGGDLGVGGERDGSVEESEGLQTGLHLIHPGEAIGTHRGARGL